VIGKKKEGYRLVMALTAFCTVCQRTVYIEDGETPVCPVCSSPLLETVEGNSPTAPEDENV
jgi:Zn finger protein HypA/HybF involved in hydrogenase expression